MPRPKYFVRRPDILFMVSGAGVFAGIFVVGYFFLFSFFNESLLQWYEFFIPLAILVLLNSFLLIEFWKRHFHFGIAWQAFMLLWGPLAIWYWLFAPLYYYFTVNLDFSYLTFLGFIFLWEVPIVGGIFIAVALLRLLPLIKFRETGQVKNPHELYRIARQYPIFVAFILFSASVVGYAIGTFQLETIAGLAPLEQIKSLANGFVMAIFIALFYYLAFDRFLLDTRLILERRYSIRTFSTKGIVSQIFTVTMVVGLGSIALSSILVLESWQIIERNKVLVEMRNNLLALTQDLASQIQENQVPTEQERLKQLEVLRQGTQGDIIVLNSQFATLEGVSPRTAKIMREQSFGILEDYYDRQKIILFSDDIVEGKTVVSIAYLSEFYGNFQQTVQFIIVAAFFIVVLIVCATVFLSFAISGRARRLDNLVQRVQQKGVRALRPIVAGDEFDNSSRSFIQYAMKVEDLQRKLQREKKQYESIIKDIAQGLVVTDEEGRVTTVNNAVTSLLGYTSKELLGKKWIGNVLRIEDEAGNDVPAEQTATLRALRKKQATTASYYYVGKDGNRFPVHVTASPLNLEGKTIGSITLFRDITEEKEIDKAKDEFVSMASHQLRTPLTTIRWSFEKLLRREKVLREGEDERYTNQLLAAIRRMNRLIDTLLNVSRIELGTLRLNLKPLNAVSLVEQVIKEIEPMAEKKRIQILVDWEDGLPNVVGDPNFLVIVFQNLITNAVKYTPEQGIVTITGESKNGNVLFTVKDTGHGIPLAQQDKIFTKMFRAENVASKYQDGTGLGLYIVKYIVEHSNGDIWFTSKEGKGTTFFFTLPTQQIKQKSN